MIPLRLAEVAAVAAGRRQHRSRRGARDGAGRARLPARLAGRAVRRARRRAGRRARLRRRGRRRRRRRRRWSPVRSTCPHVTRRRRRSSRSAGWPAPWSTGWSRAGWSWSASPGRRARRRTKDLLAQVLAVSGPTVATEGSLQQRDRLPLTALRADAGTRYLVVEMGARGAGHIAYLCRDRAAPDRRRAQRRGGARWASSAAGRRPREAKAELVQALPAGREAWRSSTPTTRSSRRWPADAARVVTVGAARGADVRADGRGPRRARADRRTCCSAAGESPVPVRLRLHGAHHVANSLAAAAVALQAGLAAAQVAAGAGSATPPQPRGGWRSPSGPTGSRSSTTPTTPTRTRCAAALDALAAMSAGRRTWAVLGEMLELGAASAAGARRGWADWPAGRRRTAGRRGRGGARRSTDGALAEGCCRDGEESVRRADVPLGARAASSRAAPR